MNDTSGIVDLGRPAVPKASAGETIRGLLAVVVVLSGVLLLFGGVALLLRGLLELVR